MNNVMRRHWSFGYLIIIFLLLVLMPSLVQASDSFVPNFYPARVIASLDNAQVLFTNPFHIPLTVILLIMTTGIFAGFTMMRQEWDERVGYGLFVLYFLGATLLYMGQKFYSTSDFASLIDAGLAAIVMIGLWIARYFLQLTERSYLEQIMFIAMAGFALIGGLSSLFLAQDNPLFRSLLLFVPAIFSMLVMSVFSLFQRGRLGHSAFLFSLGWMVISCGTIISAFVQAQKIPSLPVVAEAFWIALVVQAMFFVIAIIKQHQVHSTMAQQRKTREIQNAMAKERLRKAKESVDQTRLIRVIEREREIMAELRQREMLRTEEMRVARDAADKSNEAKSTFLAVMSHEIRTPLNGIIGTMKSLQETSLDVSQKKLVSAMYESSDSMITLLSDILDFEKIQQGRMEIENIDFDLDHLITSMITIMQPNADARKIDLIVERDENVPGYVRGDPTRLRQVLTNLLSNGIKFTDKGHVKLIITKGEEPIQIKSKPRSKIIFCVEDTGIGISKEAQKHLFKPFQQADKTITRKYGGSGLGLSISKKLVEGMGSNLHLESARNEGAKFTFMLSMDHAEDEAILTQARQERQSEEEAGVIEGAGEIAPMSILVVDDNELNRKVISSFLIKDGHDVVLSDSGEDAIKRCQVQPFDIIFLDIWMGGISGFEAVKMIRALPNHDNNLTPIVAITGSATTDTVQQIEQSGIEAYIEKPVNYEALLTLLKRFAMKKTAAPPKKIIKERKKVDTIGKKSNANTPAIQAFLQSEEAMPESNVEEPIEPINIETLPEGLFDKALIQGLLGTLSPGDFKSLIQDYMKKADEIVFALKKLNADAPAEDIAARAHEIKGMAANFGIIGVSSVGDQIEKIAQGGDAAEALELTAELEGANSQANESLRVLFE